MADAQAITSSDQLSTGARIKSIFGGSVGNLIEWFDFYVYNYAALYFAKSFFPGSDPTVQYLNAFGIYAGAFFIRPVGSWILGAYADRAGRRASLSLSVVLMCGGSLMIAVAPSYAEIGVWSPLILIAARLLQGISLGGEYGTSATYLSEVAGSKNRGFYSSFQYVTLVGGQVLGSATVLILQMFYDRPGLEAGGWRIPFYIGAAFAVFGFYLRRGLVESAEFEAVKKDPRPNPFSIFKTHPKAVALVFGLTMGGTTAFYTYTTYMPTFLVNTVKLSPDQATQISFITLLIFAAIQPLFGALSDRIGRDEELYRRIGAEHGLSGDRLRLHLDQRRGEGRVVPRQGARVRCGLPLRPRQRPVRRHRALYRALAQKPGDGEHLLLVCHRADLHLAAGLFLHG